MENKDSYIFLDKDTAFQGEISTGHLILEGVIEGEILATHEVFLKEGAIVQGGIATPKYMVEEGSVHHGKLTMAHRKKNGSPKKAMEKALSEFKPTTVEEVPSEQGNDHEKQRSVSGYSSSDTQRLW